MKYRDLVQFDPIETVIQLRDADKTEEARKLVGNYVVSEEMAQRLIGVVAAHLEFTQPDPKGIFVVGNYGTGKSHLMAVVSALAEDADLLPLLAHEGVRDAFEPIAGRFLVARFEIGAVKTSLRDIVVREIEKDLKTWGVDYQFPSVDKITNHKDAIEEMLAAVEAVHPGKGVLIVIDELLDYLKSLGEGAISAFNFLRELGEATSNGRFRVIAGVQEQLVNSPSFSFLAALITKVAARFVEVWITRTDLEFVVSSRLLGKAPEQRERIREHLEKFTPLFPAMSAAKDNYIRLYPVHPRYLQIFEQIDIAEKREVLKTLSQEMTRLLDQEVPIEDPGLIAYDSYWRLIKQTPSYLADPAVGEVSQRSAVVAAKVSASLAKPQYKPAADRIVDALSVHRLAVGGIRTPIGLSPTELRDDLALMLPVPEKDPEFLATTIESVLKDILVAVNGQFVSRNDSGQFYLDLDKAIDYDAQVAKKVASLEPTPEKFDQYYFDLLTRLLEINISAHVPGMRIWQYELDWPGHGVKRPGYLFFGSPNERSTAQPPRTFYLYFLAYFAPTAFEDARREEEVFLRLARSTPDFVDALKGFSAATELSLVSSGDEKAQYSAIADRQRKAALRWLGENVTTAFDITAAGETRALSQALAAGIKGAATSTPRELVNALASAALTPAFDQRFPGYPSFTGLAASVTEESRAQTATEGLRYVAGTIKTDQGRIVVDSLGLLKNGTVDPSSSPYAAWVRDRLGAKPSGHVLNRAELVETIDGTEVVGSWRLEPEWFAVVLQAMAYRGEIEISASGQQIDAASLVAGASLGAEGLGRFKTIQAPKAMPLADLQAFFGLLGINPALLTVDQDEAVRELQAATAAELQVVLTISTRVPNAQLGGVPLWEGPEAEALRTGLDDYRDALDRVQAINTPGKLKQFRLPDMGITGLNEAKAALAGARVRLDGAARLEPLVAYLREGQGFLSPDDPLQITFRSAIDASISALDSGVVDQAEKALKQAKATYVDRYLELHHAARLDMHGDERRKAINESNVVKRLALLDSVEMLATGLTEVRRQIASLLYCRSVDATELETSPGCHACRYRPALDPVSDAAAALTNAEDRLEKLNVDASTFLGAALDDPVAKSGLDLLPPNRAAAVLDTVRPDVVPDASTIQDLNTVLQGLRKVSLTSDAVLDALRSGGPATDADFQKRLADLVDHALAGKDRNTARLVIE